MIIKKSLAAALLATTIISISACTPTVNTRGNLVDSQRLATITPGVSRKADVEAVLGTPTTKDPFDNNIWYYMGEKTSNTAFFEHEVTQRRVLSVTFDENETVKDIQDIDKSASKDIKVVDATTATAGKKMNMLQQFFSNLGKFNTNREANTGL